MLRINWYYVIYKKILMINDWSKKCYSAEVLNINYANNINGIYK